MAGHPPLRLHTPWAFARRVLGSALFAAGFLAFSIGIGVVGYCFLGGLSWVDSLFNAAMILTGMVPVIPMPDEAAKIFASLFAIYSGAAHPAVTAIILYPLLQRMMVVLHLQARAHEAEGL